LLPINIYFDISGLTEDNVIEPFIKNTRETNPIIEAFFAQKLEEARRLMANARRAPQQENG